MPFLINNYEWMWSIIQRGPSLIAALESRKYRYLLVERGWVMHGHLRLGEPVDLIPEVMKSALRGRRLRTGLSCGSNGVMSHGLHDGHWRNERMASNELLVIGDHRWFFKYRRLLRTKCRFLEIYFVYVGNGRGIRCERARVGWASRLTVRIRSGRLVINNSFLDIFRVCYRGNRSIDDGSGCLRHRLRGSGKRITIENPSFELRKWYPLIGVTSEDASQNVIDIIW